jgi:hypothetical protein
VIGGGPDSGLAPSIFHALALNLAAFTLLGTGLVWLRYQLAIKEQELESVYAQAALKEVA